MQRIMRYPGFKLMFFNIMIALTLILCHKIHIYVKGDRTSKEDVRKIFTSHQIDVVFHSASYEMSGKEQVSMLYLLSEW